MKTSAAPFRALEIFPEEEARSRWARVREIMTRLTPGAAGLLVFSRINLYYLAGTLGCGAFWLPREGDPVLLLRKGWERARLESPVRQVLAYRSYRELPELLAGAGAPLPGTDGAAAAEMGGLPWSHAVMLQQRLPGVRFVAGDAVLTEARAVKTDWELAKMREAGSRHQQGLSERLPRLIRSGMTEREIARLCIDVYLQLGHGGLLRMAAPGEEVFFGHVAADDSGNYPHYYNGPMGFRGIHPAQPCLGSETVWRPGTPLTVDMAFAWQGYATDKTQMFWAGGPGDLPDKARAAYDLCVEIHDRAASALRPGVTPAEIWKDALERVGRTPFADGFMGLGDNRVPFLGHGIGLTIDERPVVANGFDRPLEEGMTLALEPKIGIPGFGMVGLENTFEVGPEGGRCLTGGDTGILFLD